MELVSKNSPEGQDVLHRRERFSRERDDDLSDGMSDRDYSRDSSGRASWKRSPSAFRGSRDDRRPKRRCSVSPRGNGHRRSREDGDRYVPSYVRDGYSRTRFSGQGFTQNLPYTGFRDGRGSIIDPLDLDYLVSPAQFAKYLISEARCKGSRATLNINKAEIERRYGIYRENFVNRQQANFFEAEKHNEWARERYHPVELKPLKEQVNKRRLELLNVFEESLEDGKYDDICYDDPDAQKSENEEKKDGMGSKDGSDVASQQLSSRDKSQDSELGKEHPEGVQIPSASKFEKFRAGDSITCALFIRVIPPSVKRADIEELCKDIKGFKYLCLSDPKPEKGMQRLGWVVLDKNADIRVAFSTINRQVIDDFTLNVQLHRDAEQRVRAVSAEAGTPERLKKDLELIRKLAKVLEEEIGAPEGSGSCKIDNRVEFLFGNTQENGEDSPSKEEEVKVITDDEGGNRVKESPETKRTKLTLDMFITYLRCVHQYDYYSGVECISSEDFCRRSLVHLRPPPLEKFSKKGWAEQLELRINVRMAAPEGGPEIVKLGGKTIEGDLDKALSRYAIEEDEGKSRCGVCKKLFKAEEFVKKHIKLKHSEIVEQATEEIVYFNNFIRDQQCLESARLLSGTGGGLASFLSVRNQAQMRSNILGSVVGQVPGMASIMPNNVSSMGIASWRMFLSNMGRFKDPEEAASALYMLGQKMNSGTDRRSSYQFPPGDDRSSQFGGGRERERGRYYQDYLGTSSVDFFGSRGKGKRPMSYRDLDAGGDYGGDVEISYD